MAQDRQAMRCQEKPATANGHGRPGKARSHHANPAGIRRFAFLLGIQAGIDSL